MLITASLAPPWAGPHRLAMPAAMHAYGFARLLPAILTVLVLAFCSWSACNMHMISTAFTILNYKKTLFIFSSNSKFSIIGFANIM